MKEAKQDYCHLCLVVDEAGKSTGGTFCKDFLRGREVFKKLPESEGPGQFWSSRSTGTIADCGKFQQAKAEQALMRDPVTELV